MPAILCNHRHWFCESLVVSAAATVARALLLRPGLVAVEARSQGRAPAARRVAIAVATLEAGGKGS